MARFTHVANGAHVATGGSENSIVSAFDCSSWWGAVQLRVLALWHNSWVPKLMSLTLPGLEELIKKKVPLVEFLHAPPSDRTKLIGSEAVGDAMTSETFTAFWATQTRWPFRPGVFFTYRTIGKIKVGHPMGGQSPATSFPWSRNEAYIRPLHSPHRTRTKYT